ncbi:MAG TPA: hypothetical protein VER96_40800, partial [Polyangiaceae bacterium]|nr:hypothetical protein [Polyangiaceae bacterium]
CLNQTSDFNVQLLDVDGRPPEEIVVARHDVDEKPRPSPDYECDTVETTSYTVYQLAPSAALIRMPAPKGILEKLDL